MQILSLTFPLGDVLVMLGPIDEQGVFFFTSKHVQQMNSLFLSRMQILQTCRANRQIA